MNTLDFFRAILPGEGTYFLAVIDKAIGRVGHRDFSSVEEMAKTVAKYSSNPNINVYHACAAYKAPFVEIDDKKKYRDPSNWLGAKAFWIDIDCGEDKAAKGDGYLTKREGATAVIEFCNKVGLPHPMMVDSGNGVHCYWPLSKSVNPDTWRKMAAAFKAILAHYGVLADPTCTADLSRILRPVGGLNRKSDEPKEVKCVREGSIVEPEEFAKVLKEQIALCSIVPEQTRKVEDYLNDDLTAHLPPKIPSYAVIAADKCTQLAQMRDTKGDVNYEHWRGVIGVIHHCEEGIGLAHEWSARREETGHAQNDVDTKFNTWSSGPTTCEFFSKCNPDACAGCTHKGKITSPIILGRKPIESEETVEEAIVEEEKVAVVVPKFPDNYKFEDGMMVRYMQDKDGIWHSFSFCTPMFYPIQRIRKEDGRYAVTIRMHLPDHRIRDFEIDNAALASPNKIMEALSPYEVILTNTKDAQNHLTAYVRDSFRKLQQESQEINTMVTFGWRSDMSGFLVGDRMYHRDGTTRKVLTGGYANANMDAFPHPVGTLEGYSKALNHVYSHEGMEPQQYAICAGFGSALAPFAEEMYKGLMLVLSSVLSGKGKTTICNAAMYGWGDAEKMTIAGAKGATANARWAKLGAYQNISPCIDEITKIKPDEVSSLAYQVSMGSEPARMTTAGGKGVTTAFRATWALNLYATCNMDIHVFLGSLQLNTAAEAVRVLQINLDSYDTTFFRPGEVNAYIAQMHRNMGRGGEAFIKYVVTNQSEITDRVAHYLGFFEAAVPEAEYRFYRNHAACTLASAEVMVATGVCTFDIPRLAEYAKQLLIESCNNVVVNNSSSPEESFNAMLNDLSPRILVTNEFRDSRDSRGPENVGNIQIPAGRYIRQHPTIKCDIAGRLYLAKKEIRDWCVKNRINEHGMLEWAKANRILIADSEKVTIGRGTTVSTSNLRAAVIDMVKLESMAANPTKFTLHTGGSSTTSESAVSSAR